MKKVVSLFAMLILSISSILAQTDYRSVKGYVIDKNGNPIPGAEVTPRGGSESVITDFDGSFNISVPPKFKKLTATYDGMNAKTLRIKPEKDLVFTLKKERKYLFFLNGILGFSYNMHGEGLIDNHESYGGTPAFCFGYMAGMLGKWGFYGKVNGDLIGSMSITGGVIKRIYKRTIFIYTGAGYGSGDAYYSTQYYGSGIAADLGCIFKLGNHFNLTIGYNLISIFSFTDYNDVSVGPNYVHGLLAGVGFVF